MGRAPGGGGMGRGQGGGATAFRFTSREVSEMEKALENSKGSTPPRAVVLSLAENFTNSAERAGQKPIQWKQVWNWFQNRRHSQKAKIAKSPETVKPVSVTPEPQANKVVSPSVAVPSGGPGRSRSDSQQMEFEAKSARDGAWYDVSTFISHRVAVSGDPEVRVRFSGFGSEEDEWVNVRSAVRQRSLPCEASECVAVLPGDLILCFQEGNEQALYFDADVLDVQRRRHDVRGCRCRFWVRYRHDQAEEVVPLRKVCRRPETEYRLLKLQSYGKSSVIPAGISQAGAKPDPDPALSLPGDGVVTDAASSAAPMLLEAAVEAAVPPSSAGEMLEPSAVMGEVAALVQVAPDAPPSSSAAQLPDHNPGADQMVEPSSERAEAQPVVEGPGATLPVHIPSVQQTQAYGQEVPSLQAPPEIFNSESESIIVLDRSDIEGINRPSL